MYLNASSFSLKPTLPYLENKFSLNESLREKQRRRITTAIEWTFSTKASNWAGFEQSMQREGINVVVQEAGDKGPAGIYFIDHHGKSAFSGDNLGVQYNLGAIREKCVLNQQQKEILRHHLKLRL